MIGLWSKQILAVMRLEIRKSFLARRGLWVYLLAFAPVLLYGIHAVEVQQQRARLERHAQSHPIDPQALRNISKGLSIDEVVERLGDPYWQRTHHLRRQGNREERWKRTLYKYTDGHANVTLQFADDILQGIHRRGLTSLPESQFVFAATFQFYFLHFAIFFGCVGIFINLFRGEMLEKSLHFYMLTPMRREVLLAGKYLAGLTATVVIFTSSAALQYWAMLWQFEGRQILEFLAGSGWSEFNAYLGVTALACFGFGSLFLAIGLLFRNPIVPTVMVLLWEQASPFLPPLLKKMTMTYYLQSLCPITARPENLPPMITLLISPTEPATPTRAIVSLILLTLLVLIVTGRLARRLEINYSTD